MTGPERAYSPLQVLGRAGIEVSSNEVDAAVAAIAEELVPPVEGITLDAICAAHRGRWRAKAGAQLLRGFLQARPQLRGGFRRQVGLLPI